MNLRRHGRFLLALAAGLVTAAGTIGRGAPLQMLLAGNAFFLVYLGLTAIFVAGATPAHLRRRAIEADEGLTLILTLTGAIVAMSLGAIFVLMREIDTGGAAAGVLAVASVPLGWLVLHTLAAFHYANLYYAPRPRGEAGGLDFPRTDEPGPWDFLYFAFVIGMTAQVSDVAVTSTPMRKAALLHGIASFFYNAVILALAVNAALAYAG